jgi:ABC-type multidrug transport system fused ATPase/permease subunit
VSKGYLINTATFRSALKLFSRNDKKKLAIVTLLQVFIGAVDLIGIALIGLLGALAVSGIQSKAPGNRVSEALRLVGLNHASLQSQSAIIGICASGVLILRTLISIFFNRKTLYFISRRSAAISQGLISRLLSQNLSGINSFTIQETLYAVTTGVNNVTLGIVGTSINMISDVSLLAVMATGLFFVDPITAIATLVLFTSVAIFLSKIMHHRVSRLGREEATLNIESSESIVEVLTSYREALVRGRRAYYADKISNSRFKLANVLAELSFMPNISKYVMESTMIVGVLLVSAIQFYINDAKHAVATMSVFIAAGTRIAPAVLRVQQSLLAVKSSSGAAENTFKLLSTLPKSTLRPTEIDTIISVRPDFKPEVLIQDLNYRYPNGHSNALNDITFKIPAGTSVAIVGPSGAGKTTLVDVMLGVISPSAGTVKISGFDPLEAIIKFPGAIGYIPQDVVITHGTIRENIALGFDTTDFNDGNYWDCLKAANLDDFVLSLPDKLETTAGARGTRLSGGQRQRLGIARALVTNPGLLVMDESTSALDGEAERVVSDSISKLKGRITLIIIAHRLSSIRDVDQIMYLENGKVLAIGTFEEVRKVIPSFDQQAKLMGL